MLEIPTLGIWYKVIAGTYSEFIGECISFNEDDELSVILQDLYYNSRAVYLHEIEQTPRQPSEKKDISNDQKN